jgi:hypothetical protein
MTQSMSKEVNLILSRLISLWEGKYLKMVGSAFSTTAGKQGDRIDLDLRGAISLWS